MGGEKLKLYQPYKGVLFVFLFICLSLFLGVVELSAQEQEPLSPEAISAAVADSTRVDESTIFLGEAPDIPAAASGSTTFVVFRMVLVLAVTALAIYGVVFFIKRVARPQESRDPHLKVLARTALSNDTFAAVISVGEKAWLVSGGSGAVNLISEIDDKEPLESMLLDDANRASEPQRFIDFRSLLSKFNPSKNKSQGIHAQGMNGFNTDFLKKQRERLRGGL